MKKGQQHKVVVHALANSGDGVGRIEDKVVFIPFAVPGDSLLIEITENKKSFSKGRIIEVLEPSKHRREAPCPYFGTCGGCHWQNLSEENQRIWKKKNLLDALQRIGRLEVEERVHEVQPSPLNFGYRNRIQVHVNKQGPCFLERGGKNPIPIEKCLIASEAINDFLEAGNLSGKKGKWELAEMENGKVQLFSVNEKGVSDLGFRQVNSEQNDWLKQKVVELVEEQSLGAVIDLYCGQGNWGVALDQSPALKSCLGIDSNPINIEKARAHQLKNCDFLLGDAGMEYLKLDETPDLILIDPPRAGCSDELIEALIEKPSHWMVYISCHPATMARDLMKLVNGHWSIVEAFPVDMFPQTSHLECLTLLRSNKSAKTANN